MTTVNHIIRNVDEPLDRPLAAGNAWPAADAARVDPAVEEYVKRFFPMNKKQKLAEPRHLNAFYQGLQTLPLRQPKAGDGAQAVRRIEADNRKIVYDYVNAFDGGNGKRAYPKMIERGMALMRAAQLLEKDISVGRSEQATLDRALKSAFAAVSGLNAMSMGAFYQSMMIPGEELTLADFE